MTGYGEGWNKCDECGGATLHYDYTRNYSICEFCVAKKNSPKGKARKMIDDWKRKNFEGGYKGLTDLDCPTIYSPYIPLDENE